MKTKLLTTLALAVAAYAATAQTACNNSDFESSSPGTFTSSTHVAGWTVTRGANTGTNNSCNLAGCCPQQPSGSEVISTATTGGYVDPVIGSVYPIYSVFGTTTANAGPAAAANPQLSIPFAGDQVFRLNNKNTGTYAIERISRTINVTNSNYLLNVAYMLVTSPGHGLCDAAGFFVTIGGSTCNVVGLTGPNTNTASTFYVVGSGAVYNSTVFASQIFTKWQVYTVDLSAYLNQNVTLDITATHCTAGGHYGYGYVDAQCGTSSYTVNGLTLGLAPTGGIVGPCSDTAVITAPSYYNSYQWSGPAGFTSTASTISTTLAGTYTLTVAQGTCSSMTKTIQVVMPQPLVLTGPTATIVPGSTATLSASGASSYTWSTGQTGGTVVVTPTTTTTYTVNGTTSTGCPTSGTIMVHAAGTLGMNEQGGLPGSLKIYPNPARESITIMNAAADLRHTQVLRIFDSAGRLVKQQLTANKENVTVLISDLAPGYYVAELSGETGAQRGRFTISRQ